MAVLFKFDACGGGTIHPMKGVIFQTLPLYRDHESGNLDYAKFADETDEGLAVFGRSQDFDQVIGRSRREITAAFLNLGSSLIRETVLELGGCVRGVSMYRQTSGPDLARATADFSNHILIVQRFPRSSKFIFICAAPNSNS